MLQNLLSCSCDFEEAVRCFSAQLEGGGNVGDALEDFCVTGICCAADQSDRWGCGAICAAKHPCLPGYAGKWVLMARSQDFFSAHRLWFGRVRFTPGFLFLAALLLYQSSTAFLISFLMAAALHELAHVGMARLLGISVRTLSMTAFGCVLTLADEALIPNQKLLLIAAAGPLLNLSVAAFCQGLTHVVGLAALFGAENLLLALFNLLPVFPLDGAVILSSALSFRMLPERAGALDLWRFPAPGGYCGDGVIFPTARGTAESLSVCPLAGGGLVQKIGNRPCLFSFFQVK